MSQTTPTADPKGHGPYESEDQLPYMQPRESEESEGSSGGASRPGQGGTSNRDAGDSHRHRRGRAGRGKAGHGLQGEEVSGGAGGDTPTEEEQSESDAVADATDDDSLFNDTKKGRWRNLSPRAKAAAGLGGFAAAGITGVFLMGIGPFQFIQFYQTIADHFGNNEGMMDGRVSRLINYGRHTRYRNNLGYFSNKIADIYEGKLRAAGFDPVYEDSNGTSRLSIQAYKIDPETDAGRSALGNLQANGVDIPDPGPNGLITINLRGRGSTKLGRQVINASLTSIGNNRLATWSGARFLKIRAQVDMHPMRNRLREEGEETRDAFNRRVNEELDEDFKNGHTDVPDGSRRAVDNPDDTNGQIDGANGQIDDIVDVDPNVTAGNLQDAFVRGSSILGILTILFTLDKFGDQIADIQYQNVILPLMRMGTMVMATGAQAMVNMDFNAEEMGAFNQRLFDPETGLGWSAAKSIQAEFGVENPSGPDMPDAAKPGQDKPQIFKVIDRIVDNIPGGDAIGGFITSGVGGWFSGGVDIVATAISGGTWAAIRAIIFEIIGEVAGNALAPFFKDLALWLAGDAIEEFARGALFGNYANYGSRLAANDVAISSGGIELTPDQELVLDTERKEMEKTQLQNKNVFARMFDPYEKGSLVSRTLLQNPNLSNPQAATTHFAQMPTTIFNQLGSTFSNLFTPKAMAVGNNNYDYGFPTYGFAKELQDEPKYEDPYENARIVYDQYDVNEMNRLYGDCFNTTLSPDGKLSTTAAQRVDLIDKAKCNNNNNEPLVRYRFLIADTIAMKSMECLNNLDEGACTELGFGTGADAAGGGTGTLPTGDSRSLAQTILDNPNIGKDAEPLAILQSIAGGNSACPSVNGDYNVDPELLRVIAALGQNNSFTITSLHRGCTGSTVGAGTASRHWRGKAADVSGSRPINGVTMPSFEAYDNVIQRFINEAIGYLPPDCELGVPNTRYVNGAMGTNPACTNIFLDTAATTGATGPHVHIGVP